MKKLFSFMLSFFLAGGGYVQSQDTLLKGKTLSFPTRKYGICFGNAPEFTGFRINFADRNVKKVVGMNITFWSDHPFDVKKWLEGSDDTSSFVGLNLGVLPSGGTLQPFNVGILEVRSSPGSLNGVSLGGLAVLSTQKINGISVSGLITQTGVINGISISGLFTAGVIGINGLSIGGFAVSSDRSNINGVSISPLIIFCGKDFNGLGIAGVFQRAETFNGVCVAGFNKMKRVKGLSVGMFNHTAELHGVQFGLLNYAGNNRKGFKWLPLVNLNVKR